MNESTIELRATRGLRFNGQAFAGGARIKATPLEAAALLDSGRAVLADAKQLQAVADAVQRDLQATHARTKEARFVGVVGNACAWPYGR